MPLKYDATGYMPLKYDGITSQKHNDDIKFFSYLRFTAQRKIPVTSFSVKTPL